MAEMTHGTNRGHASRSASIVDSAGTVRPSSFTRRPGIASLANVQAAALTSVASCTAAKKPPTDARAAAVNGRDQCPRVKRH
jgi:hypothetical protein